MEDFSKRLFGVKITTLRSKVVLYAVLVLMITMASVCYVSYSIVRSIIIEKVYDDNYNYIKAVAGSIENLIQESKDRVHFLYEVGSEMAVEYANIRNSYDKPPFGLRIESELQFMLEIYRNFKGAMLITEEYCFYRGSAFSNAINLEAFKSSSLYKSLNDNLDSVVLLQPDEAEISKYKIRIDKNFIIGKMSSTAKGDIILLAAVSPGHSINGLDRGDIIVYSDSGRVLWASNDVESGFVQMPEGLNDSEQGSFFHQNDYLLSHYKTPDTKLDYVNLIHNRQVAESMQWMIKRLFLISIVIGMPFVLLMIFFSSRLVRPIVDLNRHIREVNDFGKQTYSVDKKMHPVFSWFSSKSIKFKLVVFYCFHTIIPAVLLIFAILLLSQRVVVEEKKFSIQQIILQTESNISDTLKNIKTTISSFSVLDEVQMLLSAKIDVSTGKIYSKAITEKLINLRILRKGIAYINIYDISGKLKYSTQNLDNEISGIMLKDRTDGQIISEKAAWLSTETDFTGNYIYPYIQPILLKMFINQEASNKDLFTEDLYSPIGHIEVGMMEFLLQSEYQSLKWGPGSDVFIIDNTGQIVSNMEKSQIGQKIPLLPSKYITFDNKDSFSVLRNLTERQNWSLVAKISDNRIVIDYYKILIYNICLLMVIVLINGVLASFISNHIVLPLKNLQNIFDKVQGGNMTVYFKPASNGDEIAELGSSFNKMMERLRQMVDEVYKSKLVEKDLKEKQYVMEKRKNEAELIAFQSQINPHFLYNTFSSIVFMIGMGMYDESIEMLNDVGKMFRKGVYRGEVIVPARDEIEHVMAYVDIQKKRYQDKLEVNWEIMPEIYDCKMLKLTLQPIVENSIYHGIEIKEGKGRVNIKGWMEEGAICFSITDDGMGMDSQRLQQVRKSLKNEYETHSIGLKNVNERIKLYYGYDYGLDIESEEGKGTRVVMKIPVYESIMEERHA